jgi:hypothetical protein
MRVKNASWEALARAEFIEMSTDLLRHPQSLASLHLPAEQAAH